MNLLKFKSKLSPFLRVLQRIESLISPTFVFWSFLAYLFIIQCFNSIWADEGHELLIFKYSHTFGDFVHYMRYEGTPWLFHLVIWLISRVVNDVYFVTVFCHILIWIIIAYTTCFRLRLGSLLAACFLFSTPALEYVINLRQYPWTIAFALLFLASYLENKKSIKPPLFLLLLGQTCVHAQILSFTLFTCLIIDHFKDRSFRFQYLAWMIFSAVLAVLQLIPEPDFAVGLKVALPFHILFTQFHSFAVDALLIQHALGLLLISVILIFTWNLFRKKCSSPKPVRPFLLLVIFLSMTVPGYLYIIAAKCMSSPRHHYLLPFAFLVLFFILFHDRILLFLKKTWVRALVFVFCFITLIYATTNLIIKISLPRTQSKYAASYVLGTKTPDSPVLIYPEFLSDTILYFLGDEKKYSLSRGEYIDLVMWNNPCVAFTDVTIISSTNIARIKGRLDLVPDEIIRTNPSLIVRIFNTKNTGSDAPFVIRGKNYQATLEKTFISPQIQSSLSLRVESYFVYKVKAISP